MCSELIAQLFTINTQHMTCFIGAIIACSELSLVHSLPVSRSMGHVCRTAGVLLYHKWDWRPREEAGSTIDCKQPRNIQVDPELVSSQKTGGEIVRRASGPGSHIGRSLGSTMSHPVYILNSPVWSQKQTNKQKTTTKTKAIGQKMSKPCGTQVHVANKKGHWLPW